MPGTTPAFSNGLGFFVHDGVVQAKNAATDASVWTASVAGQTFSTPPIVINGYVYVGTDSKDGDLYGFEATTGSQVWHGQAGNYLSWSLNAGNGLLVVPATNRLTAFETGGTVSFASDPINGSTINLGSTGVGLPITATLTISNTGTGTRLLTVGNPVISGPNAADFKVSGPVFPLSLPPGGSAKVILECNPANIGARTAILTFTTNDPTKPTVAYALTCTGALIVTQSQDNGLADTPGTLSQVIRLANSYVTGGGGGQTIMFAPNIGVVTLGGGSLPAVGSGVTIQGRCGSQGPAITIDGNNRAGDGLTLNGGVTLSGLTITGFGGRPLVIKAGSTANHLMCVRAVHR